MSHYRRANIAAGSYFFTVVSYRRQKILCDESVRHALHEAIEQTRRCYPFHIDAWVLMPDHLHCIWTLPEGDADFSKRWAKIKRHVSLTCAKDYKHDAWLSHSKRTHRESTLWQRRFWEHQIRDQHDFNRHLDYIHYNPVKHALCTQADEWPYSTLHRYIKQGKYTRDWAVPCIEEEDMEFGE